MKHASSDTKVKSDNQIAIFLTLNLSSFIDFMYLFIIGRGQSCFIDWCCTHGGYAFVFLKALLSNINFRTSRSNTLLLDVFNYQM